MMIGAPLLLPLLLPPLMTGAWSLLGMIGAQCLQKLRLLPPTGTHQWTIGLLLVPATVAGEPIKQGLLTGPGI